MSIAPALSVDLGNLRYEMHAPRVRVTLALLPAVSAFDVALPDSARLDAGPGDPAIVRLDGGDGIETVLTGHVRSVCHEETRVRVNGGDGSVDLARSRPAATYEQQSAADIARALASEAGASVGDVDIDLDLAVYVAHQRQTAAEHVAGLARWADGIAYTDGDGKLQVRTRTSEPTRAIRLGRDVKAYEVIREPATNQVFVAGAGSEGNASAPGALVPSLERLPAGAPDQASDVWWIAAPVLRTAKGAETASKAWQRERNARGTRLRLVCKLTPALRAGDVLQVQEGPDELSGSGWLLTRVVHRLHPRRGGETWCEGVGAAEAESDLWSALAGAVGSLL